MPRSSSTNLREEVYGLDFRVRDDELTRLFHENITYRPRHCQSSWPCYLKRRKEKKEKRIRAKVGPPPALTRAVLGVNSHYLQIEHPESTHTKLGAHVGGHDQLSKPTTHPICSPENDLTTSGFDRSAFVRPVGLVVFRNTHISTLDQ